MCYCTQQERIWFHLVVWILSQQLCIGNKDIGNLTPNQQFNEWTIRGKVTFVSNDSKDNPIQGSSAGYFKSWNYSF